MSDDARSSSSILSSAPSLRSPEGAAWLGGATLAFIVCATAVDALELAPEWSFVVGVFFVLAVEPVRDRLASRVEQREQLLESDEPVELEATLPCRVCLEAFTVSCRSDDRPTGAVECPNCGDTSWKWEEVKP